MADLSFTHGLMGTGKSTAAINSILSMRADGLRVRVFTGPSRVKDAITDRSGRSIPAETFSDGVYMGWPCGVDAVFVDEAQFLTCYDVEDLADLVSWGIDVYCYGLLTDFRQEFFPGSLELMRHATAMEHLTPPPCVRCGQPAVVNARLINGQVVKEGPQVLVGDIGAEYAVLCGGCYGR